MISGQQTFHREIPQQNFRFPWPRWRENLELKLWDESFKESMTLTSHHGVSSSPSASWPIPQLPRGHTAWRAFSSLWSSKPSEKGTQSLAEEDRDRQTYWEGSYGTASVPLPLMVPPAFPCPSFSPGQRFPALLPLFCRKHWKIHPQAHWKLVLWKPNVDSESIKEWITPPSQGINPPSLGGSRGPILIKP